MLVYNSYALQRIFLPVEKNYFLTYTRFDNRSVLNETMMLWKSPLFEVADVR